MVATPLASRVSRKLTRECAPRGSRNSLGNRFTSFSASLHLSSSTFSFSFSFSLVLSPRTPSRLAAVQPALCPLRCSYLRVLLIFSYYRRWACRHVSLTHPRVQLVRTRGTVHLEVHRPLPPSNPLSTHSAVPYAPLPHRTAPLGAPQVLQYVSTLLQRLKGAGSGRNETRGVSRGSKDEVKRTRVPPVDEENARASERASERTRKGV